MRRNWPERFNKHIELSEDAARMQEAALMERIVRWLIEQAAKDTDLCV